MLSNRMKLSPQRCFQNRSCNYVRFVSSPRTRRTWWKSVKPALVKCVDIALKLTIKILIDKPDSSVQTPVTSPSLQSNEYQSPVGYQTSSSNPQSSYTASQESQDSPTQSSSKKSDHPDSKLCSGFF